MLWGDGLPPQGPGPGTITAPSSGTCKFDYPSPRPALPPVEVIRPDLYKPGLRAAPGVKHGQA